MKLVSKDKDRVKLEINSPEDLWVLNLILNKGDSVKSTLTKKIKRDGEDTRQKSQNIQKKKITVLLQTEKIEWTPETSSLKITGNILEAPEDIRKGEKHTLTIQQGTILEIRKKWFNYELEKIKEACKNKSNPLLICILDRDKADFAFLRGSNYEYISEISGEVEKKQEQSSKTKNNFYKELSKTIQELTKKEKIENIIIASPAFFKEDLLKELPTELKKKTILASCYSSGKNAIEEVMKRTEVKSLMEKQRIAKEIKLVDELLEKLSKNKLCTYGFEQVKQASDAKAIEKLLISTKFIQSKKKNDKQYSELMNLLKNTESQKAEIHTISSKNTAGKSLDGIGGIAAILRYDIK